MGFCLYVDDEEGKFVLSEYGEFKSDVICFEYKIDYDLVGLENGNWLVKMVLDKLLIVYLLCIGGEWCCIIFNN